jgi:signal transduction histidine kinase
MHRAEAFTWGVIASTGALMALLIASGVEGIPPLSTFLFWIAILIVADLLPLSLGFQTLITMAFPAHLAIEILFEPLIAMVIVGLGAFDLREVRREIPLSRSLFNRAQLMLAAGAASALIHLHHGNPFSFPIGTVFLSAGAVVHFATNLSLVAIAVSLHSRLPLAATVQSMHPAPVSGFFLAQALLASLGVATAAAYLEIRAFVAAFLIPLLFARLSLLGARTQQELSERIQKQQEALLAATEKVFEERERERKRIAEDIHDSSLQMLAAATYGTGNALDLLAAGDAGKASTAITSARNALDGGIKNLRESLIDLRKSSVEAGGLMETIRKFADQLSTLWGAEVVIEGEIRSEPPVPVALAAFQILQEGLTNALKHSNSTRVTVKIIEEDALVHIVVQDEGTGFDPAAEIGADHVGMKLMKERAASVGGRIEVDSRPGDGTRLEAILPGGVAQ